MQTTASNCIIIVLAPSGAGTTAICSCIKAYQVSSAQSKERNRLEMALAVLVPPGDGPGGVCPASGTTPAIVKKA